MIISFSGGPFDGEGVPDEAENADELQIYNRDGKIYIYFLEGGNYTYAGEFLPEEPEDEDE